MGNGRNMTGTENVIEIYDILPGTKWSNSWMPVLETNMRTILS